MSIKNGTRPIKRSYDENSSKTIKNVKQQKISLHEKRLNPDENSEPQNLEDCARLDDCQIVEGHTMNAHDRDGQYLEEGDQNNGPEPSEIQPEQHQNSSAEIQPEQHQNSPAEIQPEQHQNSPAEIQPEQHQNSPAEIQPEQHQNSSAEIQPEQHQNSSAEIQPEQHQNSSAEIQPEQHQNSPAEIQPEQHQNSPAEIQPEQHQNSPAEIQPEQHQNSPAETQPDADAVNEESSDDSVPYFLENFAFIMKTVMNNENYGYLLNDADRDFIKVFDSDSFLTLNDKKLYVKLFQRKHKWILLKKIKYPRIGLNLDGNLDRLVSAGFLLDESQICDVDECLQVLPAPELRTVAASLKLQTDKTSRTQLVTDIHKHVTQRNIGTMFGFKSDIKQTVLKRCKQLLGRCYKLVCEPRSVFLRLMMLFSLSSSVSADDTDHNQQGEQLFHLLQVNRGHLVYPTYTLSQNPSRIFRSRDDLIRYQNCLQMVIDMKSFLDKHEFEAAVDIHHKTTTEFTEIIQDKDLLRHDLELVSYLRVFSVVSVCMRLMYHGVEALQKLKRFNEAVLTLRQLLQTRDYCWLYRGQWWDRLALNLDTHLRKPVQALEAIKRGVEDKHVKTGRRLSLYQRAEKICAAKHNSKLSKKWKDEFKQPEIRTAPTVTIEGQLCPKELPGRKTVFVTRQTSGEGEGRDDMTVCSVEQVALKHYQQQLGFDQGLHGEGSTFCTLFALFNWDIIFKPGIPDTFYTPYQMAPLDIYSEEFYQNRVVDFDIRLREISEASNQVLCDIIDENWNQYYGVSCVGLNWELFSSVDHVKGLVRCLGGHNLSGIFSRQARDFRHTRSGFPDLTVWNTTTGCLKLVEVKGPGDRLSTKQILWLDHFLQLGIDAEVCHVTGVGSKMIRK
ncbi:fanconi-associated nuclease 1-like [Tubulanus polymorphus]|uniref:fanconi-associated nuclease 1-like n=1 Tax=Tubulanus polymorphus TaxID=672921 RepID=UPI003DA477D0